MATLVWEEREREKAYGVLNGRTKGSRGQEGHGLTGKEDNTAHTGRLLQG